MVARAAHSHRWDHGDLARGDGADLSAVTEGRNSGFGSTRLAVETGDPSYSDVTSSARATTPQPSAN